MPACFATLLAGLLAACSQPTGTSDVAERPEGPVLDEADIFPAKQEAAFERELTDYWQDTGIALVVVSDASLDGKTIEEVAFETFNAWGIGAPDANRGLLVLIAPAERKVRIEVGCGMESRVTDLRASKIIEDAMLPHYRSGAMAAGTIAGVEELKRIAAGPPITDALPSPLCREGASP